MSGRSLRCCVSTEEVPERVEVTCGSVGFIGKGGSRELGKAEWKAREHEEEDGRKRVYGGKEGKRRKEERESES